MNVRRVSRAVLALGTLGAVLLLSKTHALVHDYDFTSSRRFGWSFALAALMVLAAYSAGLPDAVRRRRQAIAAAIGSTMVAALGFSVLQLLVGTELLPRFVVLGTGAILAPLYVLCAVLSVDGRAHDAERDRLVVVAGPDEAAELRDELDGQPEQHAVIVGVLEPRAAAAPGSLPLVDLATAQQGTVVVLDRLAQQDDSIVAQAAALHEAGLRVRTLSLCFDQWLGKLPISELERVSLMFDIGELHRSQYGRLKRVMDVGAGLAALVVFALVTPVVLAGNRLWNRGPLFFRQPRVGKNGQPFDIVKFRTMTAAEGTASTWTANDDPRITPFGKWLRRTHLDEVPQALNILRGDLSIVGPRPEQPRYVEELTEKIPFYNLRHLVRPGLTGWAQVKYRYGANEADALEKLQYEFFYLRHQSLALDLRIIARTMRSVIGRDGR